MSEWGPELAVLLGLVEGLTEFLPVSSTGHLILVGHLLGFSGVVAASVDTSIQLGVILAVEARPRRARFSQLDHIGVKTALWVGFAQCLSLIPGASRSGATIIGGLLAGMDRKIATEYSFFLALPTMIAATSYKMVNSMEDRKS